MTINISIPDVGPNLHPQITVLGVGGSGGNAVNNMMNSNLEGVDFVIANTDAQALQISNCKKKIQLGIKSTRGLGAGMRPDVGRQAAEETLNEISEKLDGSHMLFIAAGMGGGTGTGAAPVIAKLAREKGILTVGVVTKPFHFEGSQRMKIADKGLEELQQYVDTLLIIPNQNLFRIANEKTTFADAFKMADDVLYAGVRGVTDLMVQPGLINLDFSDVKTVMSEMGKAMMGTGEASGEGRAVAAAEAAIANPLIDDVSLKGAKGLIINITGGNDITLYEVDEAANRIKQEVDEEANIIYGTTCDERLEGVVRVSLVATGIDLNSEASPKSLEAVSTLSIDNSVYLQKSSEFNQNTEVIKEDLDKELTLENTVEDEIVDSSDEKALPSENPSINYINNDVEEDTSGALFTEKANIEASQSPYDEEQIETSNELEEVDSNIYEENQVFSNSSAVKEEVKSSVRKLSLFDTLEDKNLESEPIENSTSVKSEPVFQNEILEEDHEITNTKENENEFSDDEGPESEDDFNQENEEELLDIPTFLRRQAN